MEEDSAASKEEVSIVGENSKKNDEAQGKMAQQPIHIAVRQNM